MNLRQFYFAAACMAACNASQPSLGATDELIAGAKREGQVMWYTTQRPPFALAAAAAFEAKFGIKVSHATYTAAEVSLRISTEGRAGQVLADLFDGTEGVVALKQNGLVAKWQPDSARRLAAEYVDPNGYWVAANIYVLAPGFNTDLLPRGTEPQTFDDLLNPRLKGRIAWSTTPTISGSTGFVAMTLKEFGEARGMEFLRALSRQDIAPILGSPAALNAVATGEYALGLHLFSGQIADAVKKGTPIALIPMEPGLASFAVLSVTQGGPHPNAGRLLMDFLLSNEGQKIYAAFGYITVDPDIPIQDPSLRPHGKTYRMVHFAPDEISDVVERSQKVYNEIFR